MIGNSIKHIYSLLFCAPLAISAPVFAATVDLNPEGESISVLSPTMYPETISVNPITGRFLVGSFREGAIYEVGNDGMYRILVDDPRLNSVLGTAIDSSNRLYVTNSDVGASLKSFAGGAGKLAAVGIYDLETGKNLNYVDLGSLLPKSKHLANGIALDDKGNAYITDSFSPVIYKIDTKGKASIFLKSDQFVSDGINLNGIVFHLDGYLLVVAKSDGSIIKVPTSKPESFKKVTSDEAFIGGDGLTLINNNELLLVANKASGVETNTVFALSSNDGWESLQVVDRRKFGDVYPTTATVKDGKIYVVHSNVNKLMAAPKNSQGKIRVNATIQQVGVAKE